MRDENEKAEDILNYTKRVTEQRSEIIFIMFRFRLLRLYLLIYYFSSFQKTLRSPN